MNFVICFTGAPGSGKGTQSLKLFSKYSNSVSIGRISIGDELRKMNKTFNDGRLASINDIESIIVDLINLKQSINIIDGYPRSLEQMKQIYKMYIEDQIQELILFNLKLDDAETLIMRLSNRRNCPKCGCSTNCDEDITCNDCHVLMIKRQDDMDEGVITTRMSVYHDSFKEISDFCNEYSITLLNFDACKSVDEISFRIESAFRGLLDLGIAKLA